MSDTVANEPEELWLPPEEEERLTELFNQLDVNKDGRIDVNDLGKALDQMQVPQIPGQAQVKSYSIFEINKKSISTLNVTNHSSMTLVKICVYELTRPTLQPILFALFNFLHQQGTLAKNSPKQEKLSISGISPNLEKIC